MLVVESESNVMWSYVRYSLEIVFFTFQGLRNSYNFLSNELNRIADSFQQTSDDTMNTLGVLCRQLSVYMNARTRTMLLYPLDYLLSWMATQWNISLTLFYDLDIKNLALKIFSPAQAQSLLIMKNRSQLFQKLFLRTRVRFHIQYSTRWKKISREL